MPILTAKHCREAPAPGDGARILTMRHWPRGVRKERFGAWYRHLAPSPELLSAFLELRRAAGKDQNPGPGDSGWDSLMARYVEEMRAQQESIGELRRRHEAGEVISLLCGCHDPARCHRTMLAALIVEPDRYGFPS